MKNIHIITLITFLLIGCASYEQVNGEYGSYTKSSFIPSSKVLALENKFGAAMRIVDKKIPKENYFGHLSDNEYQQAISEMITGMAWTEGEYQPIGYYYYKDYEKEKKYYDLHLNSQQVTYQMVWTGPGQQRANNISVISVETNPDSILIDAFDSSIIYLVLLDNKFYIFKSAEDANSFVGNNFDKDELVSGSYLSLRY
nr:hypothetical protein 9 [Balneolaceae bacterium]